MAHTSRRYRGYRIESFFSLPKRALGSCREQKLDAVLITGSPFYPMLLSSYVKRTLGIPVILDFQDPWVAAVGGNRPFFSKGRMAHRLSVWLEPYAVQNADYITSVSSKQNSELASRYPGFDSTQMAAIPIGGDPDDFAALRLNPPLNPTVRLDPNKKNFVYVGTFLPRACPSCAHFLPAFVDLWMKTRLGQRICG